MANQDDVARLTDRIAQTMTKARIALLSTADALSEQNFGQLLNTRMADIQAMSDRGAGVQEAEFEAEAQRRFSERTGEPQDAADLRDARDDVQRQFGYAQEEGRSLVRGIGAAQTQLSEIRDDLGQAGASLDQALRDVDTLEKLPDFTGDADSVRTRVASMRTHTVVAFGGLRTADTQLENAKGVALEFGRLDREVDRYRHSSEVTKATAELTGEMTQARAGLTSVREDIVANTQNIENLERDAGQDAQLADAIRAGLRPAPQGVQTDHTAAPQIAAGEQDPRLRLMQQAPGTSREL